MAELSQNFFPDFSKGGNAKAEHPVISIVIAARNECKLLGLCLQAVMTQNFPLPYEVIVVDNASEDGTNMIARRFSCRVIRESRVGQLFAKRSGVAVASAKIVAVLDADCVPSPNWLINIYKSLTSSEVNRIVAVTCTYRFNWNLPWWGYLYIVVAHVFLAGYCRVCLKSMPYVIGGNVAFRKECYDQFDGYPIVGGIAQTELGLAKRLNRCGVIKYVPGMLVASSSRRFRAGFWNFFIQYKLQDYFYTYNRSKHLV